MYNDNVANRKKVCDSLVNVSVCDSLVNVSVCDSLVNVSVCDSLVNVSVYIIYLRRIENNSTI